mgnify:CR=1 FL=1
MKYARILPMKKAGLILKLIFLYACIFYTVLTIFLNLVLLASGKTSLVLDPVRTLWILLFCVIAAGMSVFRSQRQISAWIRYPVHYAVLLGALFVCLLLPSGIELKSGSVFVLIIILSLFYTMVFGAEALIRRSRERAKAKNNPSYVPQYEKGSDRKS